jgi:hypothetical protein
MIRTIAPPSLHTHHKAVEISNLESTNPSGTSDSAPRGPQSVKPVKQLIEQVRNASIQSGGTGELTYKIHKY